MLYTYVCVWLERFEGSLGFMTCSWDVFVLHVWYMCAIYVRYVFGVIKFGIVLYVRVCMVLGLWNLGFVLYIRVCMVIGLEFGSYLEVFLHTCV